MKTIISSIIISMIFFHFAIAQDVTTVEAKSIDISENLDLEAVASVFGESKNLEDFEYKLNDPELKISNLDLNGDGYVDYLRVVENSENQTILITIQAVLGSDIYQDVATIDVEKDNNGKTHVQVVGDIYMYGPDYIIEPVYIYSPPVVAYIWGPNYHHWHSPYYWHHYPEHYYAWHPYSCHVYHNNIHVHINANHRYYYPVYRRSATAAHIHNRTGRRDYARNYPERSFSSRNEGVKNYNDLRVRKGTAQASNVQQGNLGRSSNSGTVNSANTSSSGAKVQTNKNSSSKPDSRGGNVNRGTSNKNSNSGQSQVRTNHNRSNQSQGNQSRQANTKETRSKSQTGQSGSKQSVSKQSRSKKTGENNSGKSESQRTGKGKSDNSKGEEKGKRK